MRFLAHIATDIRQNKSFSTWSDKEKNVVEVGMDPGWVA